MAAHRGRTMYFELFTFVRTWIGSDVIGKPFVEKFPILWHISSSIPFVQVLHWLRNLARHVGCHVTTRHHVKLLLLDCLPSSGKMAALCHVEELFFRQCRCPPLHKLLCVVDRCFLRSNHFSGALIDDFRLSVIFSKLWRSRGMPCLDFV